jgi:tetratricopeptide (TPR) repeat protein
MAQKHKSYQKFVASAVSTAVVVSAIAPVAAASSLKDIIPNSFGENEINYLTSNNIIQGFADDTFRPAEKLNRGQAARLFTRALNLKPKANNQHGFKDIPKTGELAAAVSAVAAAGIFRGTNGEFDANRPLSREEMASVLVRAFKLKANTTAVDLKDLKEISPAHLNDVKTLYQNKITVGFKDKTFRPDGTVSRAEFAVFLYRAIDPATELKIEAVTDSSVKVNGTTYTIPASLTGLFNSANAAILKNAKIKFDLSNKQISKVTYLEIVESGKAGATEFAGNLVLDAKNNAVAGNVKVSGNYITLKNLVVDGDLEIAKELQNDFYSNNLVVKGKTIVNGGDNNTVVFENAKLQSVEVNKQNVKVDAKGTTTLTEMTVNTDANITADSTVKIPKLTLGAGAKSVELNAKVGNLVLTAGTNGKDVIKNYDAAKKNIEKFNDTPNPDYGTTPPPPVGGGDTTAPNVTATINTGIYNSPQVVTLEADEVGASIYYTLDGSTPTVNPNLKYTGPFTISNTSTLKYFAVDTSNNASSIVTKEITIGIKVNQIPTITKNDANIDPTDWVQAEAGATVTVSGSVVNNGILDTSNIGTFILTFEATLNGNTTVTTQEVTIRPGVVTGTHGTQEKLTVDVTGGAETNAILELYKKGTDTLVDVVPQGQKFTDGIEPGSTYYVKQVVDGISSVASNDILIPTNLTVTTTNDTGNENLKANTTYQTNFVIEPSVTGSVFGPTTAGNDAIITKNVTVTKNATLQNLDNTLQNLKISGNLIIDAGDLGDVTLKNVTVTGDIIVLSGNKGTISFEGVTANNVVVEDSNGIKLATDTSSNFEKVIISPAAISEVQLAGNFNTADIVITKEAKITASTGFAADSIEVALETGGQVEFVGTTPLLGDTEFPTVTITKSGKVVSDGSLGNIVVNIPTTAPANGLRAASDTGNTVGFEGNFDNSEIDIDSNTTLNVEGSSTTIKKVNAGAPVTITGNVDQNTIKGYENKNENASFTPAGDAATNAFAALKTASVTTAIESINSLPAVADIGLSDRSDIDAAALAINTAKALGANNADFGTALAKWNDIENKMKDILKAVKDVEKALAKLPEDPSTIKAAGYKGLEDKVLEVEKQKTAAIAKGVSEEDIEELTNYGRLALAKERLAKILEDKATAITVANTALEALPAVTAITFATVDADLVKVLAANEKYASALTAGAKASDFDAAKITKLFEVTVAVYKVYGDRALIIKNVETALQKLPTTLNLQHITAVKLARDVVADAMNKGAITTVPAALVTAEATIVGLVTTEVNALFAGADTIAAGVTLGKIETVKKYVESLHTSITERATLLVEVNKTYFLLGKSKVDALFTSDKLGLASGVTKASIQDAQTFFNTLPNITPAQKAGLEADIKQAYYLLGKAKVLALFNSGKTALALGVTKETIEAAQTFFNGLPMDPAKKPELVADIKLAFYFLGQSAVNALFNGSKTGLAANVTLEIINQAEAFVNLLTLDTDKANLLRAELNTAYYFLGKAKLATLFNASETDLAVGVTLTTINEAEALVNSLQTKLNTNQIAEFAAKIVKAKTLLQANADIPAISNVLLGNVVITGTGTSLQGHIPDEAAIRYLDFNLSHASKYEVLEVLDKNGRNLLTVFPGAVTTGDLEAGLRHLDVVKLVTGIDFPAGMTVPASELKAYTSELTIKIKMSNQQDLNKNRTYEIKLTIGDQTPPGDLIDQLIASYAAIYAGLEVDQKAALTEAAAAVRGLTDAEWTEILGVVETSMNAKLEAAGKTARAKDIMRDIMGISFSADAASLKTQVQAFRTKYADEFDVVFGTDVTVDKLLQYTGLVVAKIQEPQNMGALANILLATDPNPEQIIAFMRSIRDQVETANPNFADFDAKLVNGMGTGLDGLFVIGQNALNKIAPKVTPENLALLKSTFISLFFSFDLSSIAPNNEGTLGTSENMNLVIKSSEEETFEATETITNP